MNCNKIIYDKNCNIIIQDNNYDSNFVFVYVLQLNQTNGTISQIFIRKSLTDIINFDIKQDGFYTLVTFKVPIGQGFDCYYQDGKFYYLLEEISLQELVQLNPNVTGLSVTYDYYFQLCKLKKCFINICYEIFDTQASIKCNNSKLDSNLIYKRDLIWSTLNVIKYMVEIDQFEEAERLLERVTKCNGLCNNMCSDSVNVSNCGCK